MKKKNRNIILFFIALQFQIMIAAKALNIVCAYILYNRGIFNIPFSGFVFFLVLMTIETILEIIITVILDFHQLRPCQKVIVAANSIAKGNYDVRVDLKGPKIFNELADSFNHMAEELSSVETLRCDFINNMSHEFKTPISAISGFASMLKHDDLTIEERNEYLDIIISESERLTNLSTNILNLSKLENQTTLSAIKEVNITEQLRQAAIILDNKFYQKKVETELNGDEVFVEGDENLLKQIWINLLDNALKFSPIGGKVSIEILNCDDCVYVQISNNGEPIPSEAINRIFNKFYQNSSLSSQGNGLGLAIVKRIVDLHNGKIKVLNSNEDETTFEIMLPKEKELLH